jgi:hypothetical protein
MQHYVIKFFNDVWQISSFLPVLWFPPPIKWDANPSLFDIWVSMEKLIVHVTETGPVLFVTVSIPKNNGL